jgi:large subunit ribosomal protein L23
MNQEQLMNVILRPHTSEKTSLGNQYAFEVIREATKSDVKDAVELLFKTEVQSVRIVNVKTKPKRFGQIEGKSKAWKKAYVTLRAEQKIDFSTT